MAKADISRTEIPNLLMRRKISLNDHINRIRAANLKREIKRNWEIMDKNGTKSVKSEKQRPKDKSESTNSHRSEGEENADDNKIQKKPGPSLNKLSKGKTSLNSSKFDSDNISVLSSEDLSLKQIGIALEESTPKTVPRKFKKVNSSKKFHSNANKLSSKVSFQNKSNSKGAPAKQRRLKIRNNKSSENLRNNLMKSDEANNQDVNGKAEHFHQVGETPKENNISSTNSLDEVAHMEQHTIREKNGAQSQRHKTKAPKKSRNARNLHKKSKAGSKNKFASNIKLNKRSTARLSFSESEGTIRNNSFMKEIGPDQELKDSRSLKNVKMRISERGKLHIILDIKSISKEDAAILVWLNDLKSEIAVQKSNQNVKGTQFDQTPEMSNRVLKSYSVLELEDKVSSKPIIHFPPKTILKNILLNPKLGLRVSSEDFPDSVYYTRCNLRHVQSTEN